MQHTPTDANMNGAAPPRDSRPDGAAASPADAEFDVACLKAVAALDPNGEIGLIRELATTFARDSQEKIDGIRRQLDAGDAGAIHALTHQLKSSSGTLGLLRVYTLSRQIDDDARKGGLTVAQALFGQLETALASGRAWLMEFAARHPGA